MTTVIFKKLSNQGDGVHILFFLFLCIIENFL